MKRKLLPTLAFAALVCACSGKKEQAENGVAAKDSTVAVDAAKEIVEPIDTVVEDWDADSRPMFISYLNKADAEGCDIGEELRYCYADEEDKAYYTPRAKNYKTLANEAGKTLSISYVGVQDAPEIGYMLWGRYAGYMSGLNYRAKGKLFSGVAFTDSYMKNHTIIAMKERTGNAPKAVLDTLQARYGQKVQWSRNQCESTDGHLGFYTVQMRPKGKKCLGLRVMRVDDKVYTYEDWSEDYNDQSAWHADDGGEYTVAFATCVTLGPKGYNVFCTDGAPESTTYQAFFLRNGAIKKFGFGCYYNYIDYCPPGAEDAETAEEAAQEVDELVQ